MPSWCWPAASAVNVPAESLVGCGVVVSALAAAARRRARRARGGAKGGEAADGLPWGELRHVGRPKLASTCATLVIAYFLSSRVSSAVQALCTLLVAAGVPLSHGQQLATQVLLGHLAWVGMACHVLGDRLGPFFPPPLGRATDDAVPPSRRWLRFRVRPVRQGRSGWVGCRPHTQYTAHAVHLP